MDNVAIIIPVKSHSIRLPNKSLLSMDDTTLFGLAVRKAKLVTKNVYVTSSSKPLLDVARRYDVRVINRPPRLDGETPLAMVVKHAIKNLPEHIDRVILLQITNPFVQVTHLMDARFTGAFMGAAHCGAFYAQSRKEWEKFGLKDKSRFEPCLIEPSVDIDTPEDYNLAIELYNNKDKE